MGQSGFEWLSGDGGTLRLKIESDMATPTILHKTEFWKLTSVALPEIPRKDLENSMALVQFISGVSAALVIGEWQFVAGSVPVRIYCPPKQNQHFQIVEVGGLRRSHCMVEMTWERLSVDEANVFYPGASDLLKKIQDGTR